MAELVALEPEPLSDLVVPALERALEMARAGEISSLGIAIVLRDGRTDAIWSNPPSFGMLLGAVSRLGHKLNLEVDG
jgi:hypothetical protein